MKTVITYGSFDIFHVGHVRLLERAKALGDKLIVGLSSDGFNRQKGKQALLGFEDRAAVLRSIRFVDFVIPEECWEQKMADVELYKVDVFVMGDDWVGKFDFLKELCEVVYLPRTHGISSSSIKTTAGALNPSRLVKLRDSAETILQIVKSFGIEDGDGMSTK